LSMVMGGASSSVEASMRPPPSSTGGTLTSLPASTWSVATTSSSCRQLPVAHAAGKRQKKSGPALALLRDAPAQRRRDRARRPSSEDQGVCWTGSGALQARRNVSSIEVAQADMEGWIYLWLGSCRHRRRFWINLIDSAIYNQLPTRPTHRQSRLLRPISPTRRAGHSPHTWSAAAVGASMVAGSRTGLCFCAASSAS
jgi:hypothetical protein